MRSFLILLLLPVLILAAAASAHAAPRRHNVIVVSFDALQARHLKAYGYHRSTAPNLDLFLSQAHLFKRAITPASWTTPTHLSLFTSLPPSEHKVVNELVETAIDGKTVATRANLRALSPTAVTLAEILRKNGYATAAFTGDSGVSAKYGDNLGFDEFFDRLPMGGFATTVPMALDWLEKNRHKPFFLFLHGYDAHGMHAEPLGGFDFRYVRQPYFGRFSGKPGEHVALRGETFVKGSATASEEEVAFWRAIYDEKISRADEQIAPLFKYIRDNNLMDDTIIVMLSDHGTEFFEHGGVSHGHTLYQELLHVLFAVHLPGQRQGTRIDSLVGTMDVTPTILSLLGISDPSTAAMRGTDLAPAFTGVDVSHDVYSETDFSLLTHKRSIQTSDGWKMILTMESLKRELYQLTADPMEKHDLSQKEPKIAYELEQKILRHLKGMNAADGPWTIGCSPAMESMCQSFLRKPKDHLKTPLDRPNIVLIRLKNLDAEQMGIYNRHHSSTPFLDALFRQGVIFNHAIAASPAGTATDASILSGFYPSQNGLGSKAGRISDKLNLLPRILGFSGYRTVAFDSGKRWLAAGLERQFDEYVTAEKSGQATETQVVEWMSRAKNPYFLFWSLDESSSSAPAAAGPTEPDTIMKSFFGTLGARGLDKNTVFFLLTGIGEGESVATAGLSRLHDMTLAIVGLPVDPRHIDEAVTTPDLLPTIIDLAGGMRPETGEGNTLVPLINGTSLQRDIVAEDPLSQEILIKRGNWYYIDRSASRPSPGTAVDEMYDLVADPQRKSNLSGRGLSVETELKEASAHFGSRMERARTYMNGLDNRIPADIKLLPYP